ncbi:hypothetical protein GUITHDRAFT_150506 [Guillardia theta CCMP2712]|uniref:EF-hand domain-containing protein n=1 Tax=Guillardia theta (strain CCMP2712) TaxID=905079 RepID=L1JXV4_GUITC|nr:hypothetical protein GUITHDRAFT_150506 [Guillardia theta CCMP2712]EKX53045.1 hypothetical protein GUITHDRAFT_150506 [Guillardia theta CCMP2712]|eukprot:XP_005840025.1 hypothetical protein GUITHDRAFT_150506 [Guillardia theta CCMP2712]
MALQAQGMTAAQAFETVDYDNDSRISLSDLQSLIQILALQMEESTVNSLHAELDTDHSGYISKIIWISVIEGADEYSETVMQPFHDHRVAPDGVQLDCQETEKKGNWIYCNDIEEGQLEEDVPCYDIMTDSRETPEELKEELKGGLQFSREVEEGQLVEGVPAYETDKICVIS